VFGELDTNGKLLLKGDCCTQVSVTFIFRMFKGVVSVAEVRPTCREIRSEDGRVYEKCYESEISAVLFR
jgi:hypothetical protein